MLFYNAHTHRISSENEVSVINIEISEKFKNEQKFISAGIHPWYIRSDWENEIIKLEQLVNDCILDVIGEIGLDKKCETDFSLQTTVFEKQIEIAEKSGLPVIIHCVKAFNEVSEIVKTKNLYSIIFHAFNSSAEMYKSLKADNSFFSFGENLLINKKLQSIFAIIDRDQILLETDNSALAISEIYKKAAELLNINMIELQYLISNNFIKAFNAAS